MIHRAFAAFFGMTLCVMAASAKDNAVPSSPEFSARMAKKSKGASFDPKTYLTDLSAEARQRGYREFAYKQTPQGELRIYFKMPEGWSEKDKRPVMVFFFGGGWSGGSPFACVKEAEHFAKNGIVVGLADYLVRNRQGTMLDKCAEDARSAVRWVRANCAQLGADPARLIVGGGSAGGHIAACTANANAPDSDTDDKTISCKPNALLLYFPVASLVDGSRASAFRRLLGDDLAKQLSPAQNVTASWPKTVMFSGTADSELANGILLHDKAKALGVTFELYLAEGRGHGVARTEPRDFAWLDYPTDFFSRIGIIEKQAAPRVPAGELKKYKYAESGFERADAPVRGRDPAAWAVRGGRVRLLEGGAIHPGLGQAFHGRQRRGGPVFHRRRLHSYQDIPVLLGLESEPTAAASQNEVYQCDARTKCLRRITWQLNAAKPLRLRSSEKLPAGSLLPDELPLICAEACTHIVSSARDIARKNHGSAGTG